VFPPINPSGKVTDIPILIHRFMASCPPKLFWNQCLLSLPAADREQQGAGNQQTLMETTAQREPVTAQFKRARSIDPFFSYGRKYAREARRCKAARLWGDRPVPCALRPGVDPIQAVARSTR
jgi:hypothetical protein